MCDIRRHIIWFTYSKSKTCIYLYYSTMIKKHEDNKYIFIYTWQYSKLLKFVYLICKQYFFSGSLPPCLDVLSYCDSFDRSLCTNSSYAAYMRENCRKTCQFCSCEYQLLWNTSCWETKFSLKFSRWFFKIYFNLFEITSILPTIEQTMLAFGQSLVHVYIWFIQMCCIQSK